jgi:DNA-directed RNA polymerase subunit K
MSSSTEIGTGRYIASVSEDNEARYKSFIRPPSIWGKSRHGDFMKYTRFEKARIIGARALQISLGAPVLIDIPENVIDPIQIAMLEFEKGVIPLTVKRDT